MEKWCNMSEYHFISLLISGATAIATVLATVVALYLGLRNDRIKLKIKPARVDGDGNIPTANGSHFAVTNLGGLPQTIYLVGLCRFVRKRFGKIPTWWKVPDETETLILIDALEQKLEFSVTRRVQKSIDELKKRDLAGDWRIVIGVSAARKGEIYRRFNKELLS